MRKTVIRALYNRVTKMTLKSLFQINGSKLITLVSTDFFMFERPLMLSTLVFVAPILNVAVYILIWFRYGWEYSGVLVLLWIIQMILQSCFGSK